MLNRQRKPQGLILVIVMFFVFMVAIFGRVLLLHGPGRARLASKGHEELQARKAAEAGAAYAKLQLRENADWKGDNNTLTVDLPDLKVVEDNGNVIGWMSGPSGEVSMFRIRFNYQDGEASNSDNLPDPAEEHRIDNPFLSYNNVRQFGSASIPDVDPDSFRVEDLEAGSLEAPGGSAFLRVEGLAGRSLARVTGPQNPPSMSSLTRKTLRVIYAASIEATSSEAALSSGGDLRVNTGNLEISAMGTSEAKLRSKKGVTINSLSHGLGDLTMDGELAYDRSETLRGNLSAGVEETDEETGAGQARDFVNLTWDDVPTAYSSEDAPIELPGGIYVAGEDGAFRYYDLSLDDYKTARRDGSLSSHEVLLSSDFREARTDSVQSVGGLSVTLEETTTGSSTVSTPVLEVTKNIRIGTSSGGQEDVLFTTLSGRSLNGGLSGSYDPYVFDFTTDYGMSERAKMSLKDSIVSGRGDVAIMVNLQGENGAITAEGMAAVSAPSVTMKSGEQEDFTQHLSIYAQEDVFITTYIELMIGLDPYSNLPQSFKGYGPLNLEGLVYSWGDISLIAATPVGMEPPSPFDPYGYGNPHGNPYGNPYGGPSPYDQTHPADIHIRGALVAYGGDPTSFDPNDTSTGPGTNPDSPGSIFMAAASAEIEYDPTRLAGDPTQLDGELSAVAMVSYGFER